MLFLCATVVMIPVRQKQLQHLIRSLKQYICIFHGFGELLDIKKTRNSLCGMQDVTEN